MYRSGSEITVCCLLIDILQKFFYSDMGFVSPALFGRKSDHYGSIKEDLK